MKKLAILISGNGSNLQAIINAIQQKRIRAQIEIVISDKMNAYGLERARLAAIPTQVILKENFSSRIAYDQYLKSILAPVKPDWIILAGFMRILSPEFIQAYEGKILNIHPSLLPQYKGLNTHARVLAAKEKRHGVSVHYVTTDLDSGPIIAQAECKISPEDTVETLKKKIHILEHQLYPSVIADLVNMQEKSRA